MPDARSCLEDIIYEGLVLDIYRVEEALFLDELIGREADRINVATFGQFFGSLQSILGRFLVLSVARIFEPPSPRYPIRSIPAAIAVLREGADSLAIEQRPGLIRSLSRNGASASNLERMPDSNLTRFVADFFDRRISNSHSEGEDNARALLALKTVRDKSVAHPEAVRFEDLPKTTFAEIDQLVALAKAFVGAVGFGYLGTIYDDDNGDYLMSSDAERSTICLRRLLEKAAILPERSPRA